MNYQELANRVSSLERSNRRLRLLALLPSLAVAVTLLAGMQGRPQGKEGAQGKEPLVAETVLAKTIYADRVVCSDPDGLGATLLFAGNVEVSRTMKGIKWKAKMSPGTVEVEAQGYRASMNVPFVEGAKQSGFYLQGPPPPGANNPIYEQAVRDVPNMTPEQKRKLAEMPWKQTLCEISTSAWHGTRLQILDPMGRTRLHLGRQELTRAGGSTELRPESNITLWSETGECLFKMPQ